MSINQVLHAIQAQLSVPKSRRNNFGNYNYRNAEDIVDAVKGLLPDGYSLLLSDDIVIIGSRVYVKSQAKLSHTDGSIEVYGWAREPESRKGMDESQITGATSSYARKYALNGLFAIDDGIDADSQNNEPPKSKVLSSEQKQDAAKKKAEQIIIEYKACANLGALADVQAKYHNELKAFSERYEELFKEINTVGLQVIGGFDDKLQ